MREHVPGANLLHGSVSEQAPSCVPALMVEAERANQSESGRDVEYIDVECGVEEQLSQFIKKISRDIAAVVCLE